MAESLIKKGKKVLIAGRSEDKLAAAAKEIGAAGYYVLDTGKVSDIPSFVDKLISEHPDLDCIINNAGVQRPFQVLGPDYDFDLTSADQEIDINIRGPLHLCVLLIQKHFSKLDQGAVIMNVSSVLGFNPFSVINPNYNGTKAWLHMFTTNLRTQMRDAGSKIKVVEIAPPAVGTDLHRDRTDPDDNKKEKGANALTVEEFMEDVEEGWKTDLDTVSAGMGKDVVKRWDESMGEMYKKATAESKL